MNQIFKLTFFLMISVLFGCDTKDTSESVFKISSTQMISDFAPELWIKDNTYKGSFSEDYKTFYFFRKVSPNLEEYIPYKSNFRDGKWEEPKIMSYYEENNSYTYQLVVPKKNEIIFLSNKRRPSDTATNSNYNFWKIRLDNDSSKSPEALDYKN